MTSPTRLEAREQQSRRGELVTLHQDTARKVINSQSSQLKLQGIDPEKFSEVMAEILVTWPEEDLARANPHSFSHAVKFCVRDGLIPDGRQAAMYVNKRGEVIYLPMKEGLTRVLYRNFKGVLSVGHAREGDEIEYWEEEDGHRFKYRKSFAANAGKPPPVIAAWAKFVAAETGATYFRLFDVYDISQAKNKSGSITQKLWTDMEHRMAEKSVQKSLMNTMMYLLEDSPHAEAFRSVVEHDEDNMPSTIEAVLDEPVPQLTEQPASDWDAPAPARQEPEPAVEVVSEDFQVADTSEIETENPAPQETEPEPPQPQPVKRPPPPKPKPKAKPAPKAEKPAEAPSVSVAPEAEDADDIVVDDLDNLPF